jgi:hypothetical protein
MMICFPKFEGHGSFVIVRLDVLEAEAQQLIYQRLDNLLGGVA